MVFESGAILIYLAELAGQFLPGEEKRRSRVLLDHQLENRIFLIGDLSIADFAALPWIGRYQWAEVPIEDLLTRWRWYQLLNNRPTVKKRLDVPVP